MVGTLVVQLARQAGHRGSELHRLQDLPDGFIRVLVQHVEVHSQRAREQDGVLARRDSESELGPVTPPTSAHPSPGLTWGMMVTLDRNVCSPTWAMGTPSIQIPPSAASTSRSRPPAREDFPAPVLPTMPTCQGMGWHGLFQPGLARRQATEGSWTCTQGPSIYHHLLCIHPSICPSVLPSAQPVHISIHQSAQPSVCEFVSIFPHPDISLPSFHSFPHPSFCSFILPSFPILSSTPLHHSHLPFHPMSPVNVPSFSQSPFRLSHPSFQLH